jgi:hypothetical protein
MVYVTGFIGIESYDIIHYLSRVARGLGKKSILIDCSDSMALSYTIRNPLVPVGNLVDYRGVDFISQPESIDFIEQYDYAFIDFGFDNEHPFIDECDGIFVVTDYQLHTNARIKGLEVADDQFLGLLLRNDVGSKVQAQTVIKQLGGLRFDEENVFSLMQADSNTATALAVQYDNVFKFDKITSDLKDFIISFFSEDFKEVDVKKALKLASKAK